MRAFALTLALLAAPAFAGLEIVHGLSAFGDLKYPRGFAHFDYVNPAAPKGGRMVTTSTRANQGFDTLNAYTLRGDPPAGLAAPENLVYDTLMTSAADEPDAVYGLLAAWAEYEPGAHEIIFQLRDDARFADGAPVTAEDIVFSLEALKSPEAAPRFRLALADVESAEALGPLRVRYRFNPDAIPRDLPMLVAALPVFSKAWFSSRNFADTGMEQPVGSGPYEVVSAEPGRAVTYRRRPDYWAADLPVNVGRWNFDEITFEYFKDRSAAVVALAAGELTLHESFSSKEWATSYDFPAVRDGRVLKEAIPDLSPSGTQGWWFNLRRDKFADPRVREAIALAFDFEWSNKALFYGLYDRATSFFGRTGMEAGGAPSEAELVLLDPFRDQLLDDVFGPAYLPPATDGTGNNRANLRRAARLLEDAGWTLDAQRRRVNDTGEQLSVAMFDDSAAFERVITPFLKNLEQLGIRTEWRMVDAAQAQRRQKEFDYDLIGGRFSMGATADPSLRNLFSAQSAAQEGSYNLSGIQNPAVDALLEAAIGARTRAEMNVAGRALDRVLRALHIWVPNWSKDSHSVAWWDRYGRPEIKPTYARAILDTWWERPQ